MAAERFSTGPVHEEGTRGKKSKRGASSVWGVGVTPAGVFCCGSLHLRRVYLGSRGFSTGVLASY